MNEEKELLLKSLFTYFINLYELEDILQQKNEAARQQKYELAAELRHQEKQIRAIIPSIQEMKELYDKLYPKTETEHLEGIDYHIEKDKLKE